MNNLKRILESTNLVEEEIDFFVDNSKQTLLINLKEKEDYQEIGNCRIGGWPDMPFDYIYPKDDDKLLVFLAQLDLEKVSSSLDIKLPKTGMLYFFLTSDDDPQNVKHLVWYSNEDKSNLKRYIPAGEYKLASNFENEFPSYKLELEENHSIDSSKFCEHFSSQIQPDSEIEKLIYLPSRIGGYSQSTEGDVEGRIIWEKGELGIHERALVARGYPLNDRNYIAESDKLIKNQLEGIQELENQETKSIQRINQKTALIRVFRHRQKAFNRLLERKDDIRKELGKWKMILSIQSINELGMCWSDAGVLEIFINEDDLENLDFTNTHCMISNIG